jgi:tetratricopeptide (TPR) repeat protein
MLRRRSASYRQESDLPPTRALWWLAWLIFCSLLGAAWLLRLGLVPTALLGGPGKGTLTALQSAFAAAVTVVLVMLVIHAQWRLQLEILAYQPGPLLIYPIRDQSVGTSDKEQPVRETALAESVRAQLQRRLLDTQLQRFSTPIPPAGDSSDFLKVVETAGSKIEGFWGFLLRLAHFLAPASSYEVRCSILDPDTVERRKENQKCVLLVELTRLPRFVVPPETIAKASWSEATDAAGDWLAATVLPRTRQCALPPWTLWRNLKIPLELFRSYQKFRHHRDAEEYEKAQEELDNALEHDPTNLALLLDKGKLYEQKKEYLAALATYEEIIARAARLDRRLAYRRFGPPSRDDKRRPGTGRNWHDERRAFGLPPLHPVVYTARYRYVLLLSLGREIVEQWCEESDRDEYVGLRRRFAEAYREPVNRLYDQFPDILPRYFPEIRTDFKYLQQRDAEKLIELILDIHPPVPYEINRALMEVFLTSMEVWEAEYLIIERTGAPLAFRYRREHRKIITDRALRLLLPRAILRRALASQRFLYASGKQEAQETQKAQESRKDMLRRAESSMIYPFDEPVVEPALHRLLAGGWPADDTKLIEFIDKVRGRGFGSLRGWQFHYNAACNLATLLKKPEESAKSEQSGQSQESAQGQDSGARQRIVSEIVTELEMSVACGDLGYIASTSKWVGEQDPDFNEVREEAQFKEFRRALGVETNGDRARRRQQG